MKLRTLNQLVAVAFASGIAFTAAAQGGANGTTTQAATPNASAPSSGNASPSASGSAATNDHGATGSSGKAAHRTRAMRHQARHARGEARRGNRGESMARNDAGSHAGESQYRSALRRCVEGPQAQRDSCLDQAIQANGRA
jgi:hypothetical protein